MIRCTGSAGLTPDSALYIHQEDTCVLILARTSCSAIMEEERSLTFGRLSALSLYDQVEEYCQYRLVRTEEEQYFMIYDQQQPPYASIEDSIHWTEFYCLFSFPVLLTVQL